MSSGESDKPSDWFLVEQNIVGDKILEDFEKSTQDRFNEDDDIFPEELDKEDNLPVSSVEAEVLPDDFSVGESVEVEKSFEGLDRETKERFNWHVDLESRILGKKDSPSAALSSVKVSLDAI